MHLAPLSALKLAPAPRIGLARPAETTDLARIKQAMAEAPANARAAAKSRARETLTRLSKELALIKKMWAHNPKMMAKQIARLAKEMKAAVEEYAKAAKRSETGAGAAPSGADVSAADVPPAPPAEVSSGAAASKEGADASETAPAEPKSPPEEVKQAPEASDKPGEGTSAGEPPAAKSADAEPTARGLLAYAEQSRAETIRQSDLALSEARGDQEFYKIVHALTEKMKELLGAAKVEATFTIPRFEKSKDYEDAAKAMKELDEAAKVGGDAADRAAADASAVSAAFRSLR